MQVLARCSARRYGRVTAYRRSGLSSSASGLYRPPVRCRRAFVTSTTSPAELSAEQHPNTPSDGSLAAENERLPASSSNVLDPAVRAYLAKQHMHNTDSQGTNQPATYDPNISLQRPPKPSRVTLELLLASEAHLGHSTSLWNPANSRYLFGIRSGIHIISLEATAQHLRRAARVVSAVARNAGLILFVGNRKGFEPAVVKAAQLAAPACHLFDRWIPGSITNAEQILNKNTVNVVDDLDNPVEPLAHVANAHRPLSPDLVVCLNPIENYSLLHECATHRIPTIGVIDTNADPSWVTYPIPANDDSLRCITLIAGVLGNAAHHGQTARKARARKGYVPRFTPDYWFRVPPSFDLDTYMQRREQLNPGQLRRDVEAKLNRADLSALEAGSPVESLDEIEKRLRPDEILVLRRAYEPGFTQSASTTQDSKDYFTSPEAEAARVAKALADVASLASEAADRSEQENPAQNDPSPSDSGTASSPLDASGDPWDSPSTVVAKNQHLGLTTQELQALAAPQVKQRYLVGVQHKLPDELYQALYAELDKAGRIVFSIDDPDDPYYVEPNFPAELDAKNFDWDSYLAGGDK